MTPPSTPPEAHPAGPGPRVILSFDVEEHHRIEAAAGLGIAPDLGDSYAERVAPVTLWLLEALAERRQLATFFLVGEYARRHPALVRTILGAGHEVAAHGWDHRSLRRMTPGAFREDARTCKDALEQIAGGPVAGYRAPTFSIVRPTAWAIDVLAELGFLYDSSIYPVRHDRYGVPDAPRAPFLARGAERSILELPPATYRILGMNLPTGGGGSFRLLPLRAVTRTLRQIRDNCSPPVATLYFHPWEFDPDQPRLRLRPLSRLRTYAGIGSARGRLATLLDRCRSSRAVDVALELTAPSATGGPAEFSLVAPRPDQEGSARGSGARLRPRKERRRSGARQSV